MADLLSDPGDSWDMLLADIFAALPLAFVDQLACVSRRYRNLAQATFWKPGFLLYSLGSNATSGHGPASWCEADEDEYTGTHTYEPKLVELFYSPRPSLQIQQVACGDFYTLVSRGGVKDGTLLITAPRTRRPCPLLARFSSGATCENRCVRWRVAGAGRTALKSSVRTRPEYQS